MISQYEEAEEESQKYKVCTIHDHVDFWHLTLFDALDHVEGGVSRPRACLAAQVGKSILEAAKLKSSFVSAPPRDWSSFSASLLHIEAPDDK